MREMTVREMRAAIGQLDELVEREGEVVVTRRGRPIARIVPMQPRRPMPSHADLRRQLRPQSVPSEQLVREDRDAR
jgi:prevent-host-death family protein